MFHPHAFLCPTPPFVPGAKSMRSFGTTKNTPELALSNRLRKPVARYVE